MARFVRVQGKSTSGTANGQKQHRDAVGHLEAGHRRRLLKLAQGHHNPDGDPESVRAFIAGRKTSEVIGEELAEAFLESATSGEPCELDRLDQITEDEEGGPFITTSAEEELAAGSEGAELDAALDGDRTDEVTLRLGQVTSSTSTGQTS